MTKKREPHALDDALRTIILSDTIPSLDDFLKLGFQLDQARLYQLIDRACTDSLCRGLLTAATRHHDTRLDAETRARVDDAGHVRGLLAQIDQGGNWLHVRDELCKFYNAAWRELESRIPLVDDLPGPRPRNDLLLEFETDMKKKNPRISDKEILAEFKRQHPTHPIFQTEDPRGALRAARVRRKKDMT